MGAGRAAGWRGFGRWPEPPAQDAGASAVEGVLRSVSGRHVVENLAGHAFGTGHVEPGAVSIEHRAVGGADGEGAGVEYEAVAVRPARPQLEANATRCASGPTGRSPPAVDGDDGSPSGRRPLAD